MNDNYTYSLVHDGDRIEDSKITNHNKYRLIAIGRNLVQKRLVQFQLEIHILDKNKNLVEVVEDYRQGW
jgi:hypothetical protein